MKIFSVGVHNSQHLRFCLLWLVFLTYSHNKELQRTKCPRQVTPCHFIFLSTLFIAVSSQFLLRWLPVCFCLYQSFLCICLSLSFLSDFHLSLWQSFSWLKCSTMSRLIYKYFVNKSEKTWLNSGHWQSD